MDKLVCFGEILIDLLSRPPARDGDPRSYLQYAGGAPANVAVAAARLGLDSHFVGMLGRDMFGDFLAASLREHGVGIEGSARTDAANTALAFVALDAHGERSFSFYRPPAADLLFREPDFQDHSFVDLGVFHVCSNSLTEPAIAAATCAGMRRARAAGAMVSMDLNLREVLWPRGVDATPVLWQALALADLVKLSREELEFLARPAASGGAEGVIARLLGGATGCVIITDGAAPVRWHTRQGHGAVPGFAVTAVDTTAAGDAFMGGVLAALLERGQDGAGCLAACARAAELTAALRFGAAVGALAVTRQGAFAAMPTRAQVDHLLQTQPEVAV